MSSLQRSVQNALNILINSHPVASSGVVPEFHYVTKMGSLVQKRITPALAYKYIKEILSDEMEEVTVEFSTIAGLVYKSQGELWVPPKDIRTTESQFRMIKKFVRAMTVLQNSTVPGKAAIFASVPKKYKTLADLIQAGHLADELNPIITTLVEPYGIADDVGLQVGVILDKKLEGQQLADIINNKMSTESENVPEPSTQLIKDKLQETDTTVPNSVATEEEIIDQMVQQAESSSSSSSSSETMSLSTGSGSSVTASQNTSQPSVGSNQYSEGGNSQGGPSISPIMASEGSVASSISDAFITEVNRLVEDFANRGYVLDSSSSLQEFITIMNDIRYFTSHMGVDEARRLNDRVFQIYEETLKHLEDIRNPTLVAELTAARPIGSVQSTEDDVRSSLSSLSSSVRSRLQTILADNPGNPALQENVQRILNLSESSSDSSYPDPRDLDVSALNPSNNPSNNSSGSVSQPIKPGPKTVYHREAITIFFDNADTPNWDNELNGSIERANLSKEFINKAIDEIIKEEGGKILVFERKTDGDIEEFKEVFQLHSSLTRLMARGPRGPQAMISLGQIIKTGSLTAPIKNENPQGPQPKIAEIDLGQLQKHSAFSAGASGSGNLNTPEAQALKEAGTTHLHKTSRPGMFNEVYKGTVKLPIKPVEKRGRTYTRC